jgi:hypothetical protein
MSVNLIRENLMGTSKSRESQQLGFKDVYMAPFQCTRLSTPQGIKHRFKDAVE